MYNVGASLFTDTSLYSIHYIYIACKMEKCILCVRCYNVGATFHSLRSQQTQSWLHRCHSLVSSFTISSLICLFSTVTFQMSPHSLFLLAFHCFSFTSFLFFIHTFAFSEIFVHLCNPCTTLVFLFHKLLLSCIYPCLYLQCTFYLKPRLKRQSCEIISKP